MYHISYQKVEMERNQLEKRHQWERNLEMCSSCMISKNVTVQQKNKKHRKSFKMSRKSENVKRYIAKTDYPENWGKNLYTRE